LISYTALASTLCFMVHSMLFFWHRYELPAVAFVVVTVEPRSGNSMASFRATTRSIRAPSTLFSGLTTDATSTPIGATTKPRHVRVSRQASSTALSILARRRVLHIFHMGGEVVMHREDRRARQ
jgi:hypothetical protein